MTSVSIGDKNIQKLQQELGIKVWPPFMQHDSTVNKYWDSLYSRFINFQFAKFEGKNLVAVGNSIPVHFDQTYGSLPDTGLDWAMAKSNTDYEKGLQPNLLIAVQILISPNIQGKGISYKMLQTMKDIANAHNIPAIALPIRPTLKHKYPLIPMDEYIGWKNEKGEPYDPWIRVHLKNGGKIIKCCPQSMDISAPIELWEEWTGMEFQSTGEYVIDKALVPVKFNIEENVGRYMEPNIWIVYDLN